MLTKWHNSLKYVCKLCCEKPILYNTHIKYIYQWPGKAVYSTQANWKKNLPVVTFLQNDIMLLLTHFLALSKWNILWVMLKLDSVLSKTVEHESGKKKMSLVVLHFEVVRKLNVQWVTLKGECTIAFETKVPPTINITDSVNKSKYGIKTHLVK